jgi:hypothetical protein
MDANTRGGTVSRILRLGVSNGEKSSSDDPTAVGELEMELALLREENARLKVERHRPPDAGRIIERMRDLGQEHPAEQGDGEASRLDHTGQATGECLTTRDDLVVACQEVQQAIEGVRGRLGALSVDLQEGIGDRARPAPIAVSDAEGVDLGLAAQARASSGLAQNVA